MKVLLVNTYDRGGAAKSCIRLHLALVTHSDIDSDLLLFKKEQNVPNSYRYNKKSGIKNIFRKILRKSVSIINEMAPIEFLITTNKIKKEQFLINRSTRLEKFSFPNSDLDITKSTLYKEADIINLHWVADFMDVKSFFKKNTKPVVWTLHDMNPFLGGEHYSEKWEGISKDGRPLPRIVTDEENSWAKENLKIKEKAFQNIKNIEIVTPSKWLLDIAKQSSLFSGLNIHHIPNGLNTDVFKPRSQNFSREVFGVPKDKIVLLFVAESISNSRKGIEFLLKSFEELDRKDVLLCAVGAKTEELETIPNIIQLGVLKDERLMSLAYSLANVFVIPSLMDNLPNTVIESLLCGTPVIGFPIGGVLEMIEPGINGFLTKEISSKALTEKISLFLDNPYSFQSKSIRRDAALKYNQSIQVKSYLQIFSRLLEK